MTVTAVFNGCPSVNLIKVLTVLTGAPAAAPTFLTDAPNYHCDAWYVCRNGSLSIPNNLSSIGNDVLTITYTIEPPIPPATPSFYFKNSANQPVCTITHNYNFTTQSFGGPSTVFYSTNCTNSGRYSVQAGNCIGNSPKRTTRIFRESECWCLGTPPYPYAWGTPKPCLTPPTGCGSCGPVGNKPVKNPLSTMPIEEIKSNKLFPNPASGIVTVQMLEKGYKSIRVIGADGKNAYNFSTAEQQFKFNTSQWVQGMYLIEVTKGSTIILKEKLIVNKQ